MQQLASSKISRIFLLPFLLLAFTSCTKLVLLDNPSSEIFLVSIDDADYMVEPDTGLYVSIPMGTCSLSITTPEGEERFSGEIDVNHPGMINLTRSAYVIEEELYVDHRENRTEFLSNLDQNHKVKIRGREIRGAFHYHPPTELFIEETWNFDVLTPLPDRIYLAQFTSFAVKRKIWRENDFWEDYLVREEPEVLIPEENGADFISPEDSTTATNPGPVHPAEPETPPADSMKADSSETDSSTNAEPAPEV